MKVKILQRMRLLVGMTTTMIMRRGQRWRAALMVVAMVGGGEGMPMPS